jgi:hypothetical protein
MSGQAPGQSAQFSQARSVEVILDQVGEALDVGFTQGVIIHLFYLCQTGPAQQRRAGLGRLEQAVQVGTEDLPVVAYCTVLTAIG